MIHPPATPVLKQPWLTAAEPTYGKRLYVPGQRNTAAAEGVVITSMATISDPHEIIAIHLRSATGPTSTLLVDVLRANNPSTLENAQLTDEHLSGLSGLNAGFAPNPTNVRIPIGRLADAPTTYYKLLTYNAGLSAVAVFAFLEIIMRGTR